MTIRRKLLLLGGAGVLPIIAVGLTGWQAIVALDGTTREILTSSVALGNHWEGDMMHEGLRADVYAALADETPEQKTKSRSTVREDANRFREAVARNRKLALDPEIAAGLNELAPRLEAYIAEAVTIVDLAVSDRAGAVSRIPRFQQAFEQLDDAQVKVSDLIVHKAQVAAREADRTVAAKRRVMAGIVLLALAGLVAAAWFVGASIGRRLSSGLQSVADGSRQVAAAAAQISNASQTLAQAASEQAASIEETSASAEEVRTTTQQNAERSIEAARATQDTVQEMARAGEAVSGMVASMEEIVESASKIEKIIRVIEEIAFQTNILALNAAVEAARAGEAGLGFAVVAAEVRNLAHRSAGAANDTAELIHEAISRSRNGKEKLDGLATLIASVREKAWHVGKVSEELTAHSAEQSQGIERIARGAVQLQDVTQQIAANAEEHAAAAEELTAQSASLDGTVADLAEMVGTRA